MALLMFAELSPALCTVSRIAYRYSFDTLDPVTVMDVMFRRARAAGPGSVGDFEPPHEMGSKMRAAVEANREIFRTDLSVDGVHHPGGNSPRFDGRARISLLTDNAKTGKTEHPRVRGGPGSSIPDGTGCPGTGLPVRSNAQDHPTGARCVPRAPRAEGKWRSERGARKGGIRSER